jgi:hypothetical protein
LTDILPYRRPDDILWFQRIRQRMGFAERRAEGIWAAAVRTPEHPTRRVLILPCHLKTLGIDRRRFHDLRHTSARLLLAEDATLFEVKEILGHSQISLTAN